MVSPVFKIFLELEFIESSALTAQNVDTAFYKLISKIYDQVMDGYFDDRLEQFNYFGSAKIRHEATIKYESSADFSTGDVNNRSKKAILRGTNNIE